MANIQGLYPNAHNTKLEYLSHLIKNSKVNILALTETHLSPDITDNEVCMEGYTTFRCDRTLKSHGGVMTYIKSSLASNELLKFSNLHCSINVVYVTLLKLTVVNIYRPPNCTTVSFSEIMNKVRELPLLRVSPLQDIVVLGDFNFPRVKWPDGSIATGGTTEEQTQSSLLLNLIDDLFLTQMILKPTRGNNILDLLFTNNKELIHHYEVSPTIYSDHNIISISLNHPSISDPVIEPQVKPVMAEFDFSTCDWSEINAKFIAVDWHLLLAGCGTTEKFQRFQDKLEEICLGSVRRRCATRRRKRRLPRPCKVWYRNISNITKQLRHATRPCHRRKLLLKLHTVEAKLHSFFLNSRANEEARAIETIKSNPKYFYKYAKKYKSTKQDIGPLLDNEKQPVYSSLQMAEMFKTQFESVFSAPRLDKRILAPHNFFNDIDRSKPTLTDCQFSQADIIKSINQLKLDSAPGPDCLPTLLLKNCKESLSLPISLLWRSSLDTGIIPSNLKDATIAPIHKGDSRAIPKNYRPISLTSHLTKIFERLLRDEIVGFMEQNQLMNPNQHGFRTGRSCLTQLIEHYDLILDGLAGGSNVDVVYLDFAKAFDKVDHGILCYKLHSLGIGGKIGMWLFSFLTNRVQRVLVNGTSSSMSTVISGVPQGTVLGPVLFLVHITDINQRIESRVSSFADDTRVMRLVKCGEDVETLQEDLNKIYEWQDANNMKFNDDKFEVLRYGKNEVLKTLTYYTTPTGDPIETRDCVRDLGVVMSASANFSNHIDHTVAKVKNVINWILRIFVSREQTVMKTLWDSLVQPHLDYCSQLWAPSRVGDNMKLEALQRSFTSRIEGTQNFDYWERLSKLNMCSQQRRQERYRIIYTWKAIENMIPNFGIAFHLSPRLGRLCIVPPINTRAPMSVQSLKDASLMVMGPRLFNALPREIRDVSSCSLPFFKSRLNHFLKNIPDRPRCQGYTSQCKMSSNSILDMRNEVGAQL